jgi:hypothetical protein
MDTISPRFFNVGRNLNLKDGKRKKTDKKKPLAKLSLVGGDELVTRRTQF